MPVTIPVFIGILSSNLLHGGHNDTLPIVPTIPVVNQKKFSIKLSSTLIEILDASKKNEISKHPKILNHVELNYSYFVLLETF